MPGRTIGCHAVATRFPLIEGEQFEFFCQDIREFGQREAITYFVDGDGTWLIVDGRNRYRACVEIGREPVLEEWDGIGSLADLAVSRDLRRRHQSKSQRAAAGVSTKQQYAAEAEVRMLAGKPADEAAGGNPVQLVSQGGRAPTSRKRAADACQVNEAYIDIAEKVATEAPDVFADIVAGKTGIKQAERLLHRDRKRKAAKIAAAAAPAVDSDACDITAGDFVEVVGRGGSRFVRLFFADTPYNIGVDYGRGADADRMTRGTPDAAMAAGVGYRYDTAAGPGLARLVSVALVRCPSCGSPLPVDRQGRARMRRPCLRPPVVRRPRQ